MAGPNSVPLVLLGRYSTLAGEREFATTAVNVLEFESLDLAVWRGPLPSGSGFLFKLDASTDQETWTNLASTDPGSGIEVILEQSLSRPWLRARVVLTSGGGEFPVVTCYAVGFLTPRR